MFKSILRFFSFCFISTVLTLFYLNFNFVYAFIHEFRSITTKTIFISGYVFIWSVWWQMSESILLSMKHAFSDGSNGLDIKSNPALIDENLRRLASWPSESALCWYFKKFRTNSYSHSILYRFLVLCRFSLSLCTVFGKNLYQFSSLHTMGESALTWIQLHFLVLHFHFGGRSTVKHACYSP